MRPPRTISFMRPGRRPPAPGLPHSETRVSSAACASTRTIAACRVLHRPAAPKASALDLWFPGHILIPAPGKPGAAGHGPSPHRMPPKKTGACRFSFLPSLCALKELAPAKEPDLMGRDRVELSTPALSERCSNQLSYCPKNKPCYRYFRCKGKERI